LSNAKTFGGKKRYQKGVTLVQKEKAYSCPILDNDSHKLTKNAEVTLTIKTQHTRVALEED
jgi:hypothetical protein